jgi:hypothetical protein
LAQQLIEFQSLDSVSKENGVGRNVTKLVVGAGLGQGIPRNSTEAEHCFFWSDGALECWIASEPEVPFGSANNV